MIILDTNIIIEIYRSNQEIINKVEVLPYNDLAVSIVTFAELIFGARNKNEQKDIEKSLSSLRILKLNSAVSDLFIDLMKNYSLSHGLTIPDSIIAATTVYHNAELFTLNIKDFRYIEKLKLFTP